MIAYLAAVLRQLRVRVQYLMGLIPRDLPRDVHTLVTTCRNHLSACDRALEMLCTDPDMLRAESQLARIRQMRRIIGELDLIETVPIAVLIRWNETDNRLNRLVDAVAREIRYPLPTPVVAGVSHDYYAAYPLFGLVVVPLAESRFLLHLPDLYHELGHPLLASERNDPTLAPFHRAWLRAHSSAVAYLNEQVEIERGRRGPVAYMQYFQTWRDNWTPWMEELFCDLYAVATLGPAFVWSHFHLTVTRGSVDPYRVALYSRKDHPPDGARMTVLLRALRILDFAAEADHIESEWVRYFQSGGLRPTPEYERCFPAKLLDGVTECAVEGVTAMNCAIAKRDAFPPIAAILNEAWEQVWSTPDTYSEWEAKAVDVIRSRVTPVIAADVSGLPAQRPSAATA